MAEIAAAAKDAIKKYGAKRTAFFHLFPFMDGMKRRCFFAFQEKAVPLIAHVFPETAASFHMKSS